MPYAFDEIRSLVSGLAAPISDRDSVVRYACALVAELAYHHVPTFEIDAKKRALVVPCVAYQAIIQAGVATNVAAFLQSMDFPNAFVVVDRAVIAVGLVLNDLLFLGFRGTSFLFDWRINLRAPLVHVSTARLHRFTSMFGVGRVHCGFAEEAVRISAKITDAIRDNNIEKIDHIFLTGHSLGGAIAALSESLIGRGAASTFLFGSPRYCDVSAYYTSVYGPPTQIQRDGDIVPFVPFRRSGYADHPYQFNPAGEQLFDPITDSWWPSFLWRASLFLGKRFEPHNMEGYRRELGHAAKAKWANEQLAPYERLKLAHTKVAATAAPSIP